MAPVHFFLDTSNPVSPYYINPWHNEIPGPSDPVLRILRGDFFCLPFGANTSPYQKEIHPPHGQTATAEWEPAEYISTDNKVRASFRLNTDIRAGRVTKTITLREGHQALYINHLLEDFSGPLSLGHHAIMAPPKDGQPLYLSTSPFQWGMTDPGIVDFCINGEYHCLEGGQEFSDLTRVPSIWKNHPSVDCSIFPHHRGFTDILQLCPAPSSIPAWTVAAAPSAGYLWFSLKDPSILPSTLFWMESGGRHSTPWNGRNCCLGLEEICGYFAFGLKESEEENPLNSRGVPTVFRFSPGSSLDIRVIQGVARIPRNFRYVEDVKIDPDSASFLSKEGITITIPLDSGFLTPSSRT